MHTTALKLIAFWGFKSEFEYPDCTQQKDPDCSVCSYETPLLKKSTEPDFKLV